MSNVVFLVTSSSYSRAREGVDLILGVSAFIENITVIFADAGLRLLWSDGRNTQLHGERNFFKTMGMMELYDISDIRYCVNSAIINEFNGVQPALDAKPIDTEELHNILENATHKIVI